LQVGDKLKFIDARGRRRSLRVIDKEQGGVWLEAKKKAYVVPGTIFRIRHPKKRIAPTEAVLGAQPPLEQYAMLRTGDVLILTRSQRPGRPAITGPNGEVRRPPIVPCTLPAIFDQVKAGEKIWFDDGKLAGIITRVSTDEMEVEITQAGPRGHRLGADKGINLPDSELDLPALTDADREILRFAVQHADLIGYSFVRRAADVRELQRELRQLGRPQLGIILKIETRAAFDNLPELLLAAMENPSSGVMIARGDLAIEVGFERLAEIQEEILWMCEAAHMPVIWATQVLEQLSKKGVCSRAEITDAAMSERAECVMLNKGPFVLDAVKTLDSVLQRMQSHQAKKRAMLRPLKLAERFFTKNSLDQ
jgi:pyruvate kinase